MHRSGVRWGGVRSKWTCRQGRIVVAECLSTVLAVQTIEQHHDENREEDVVERGVVIGHRSDSKVDGFLTYMKYF